MSRANLLTTPRGRRWLFALLYLTEGAPIGFIWWALPTLLGAQGLGIETITSLTALATLPWVLKFLVAPAIDASLLRGTPAKSWILVCQLAMALTLLPLVFIDWSAGFTALLVAVVVHAVFAAVQDVAIDTLAIRSVPAAELGRVNAWMQVGMLAGRAGTAAAVTALASRLEDPRIAVVALALVIAVPAVVLLVAVREARVDTAGAPERLSLRGALTPVIWIGMAVALTVGAGFEFFGVSAGPRLLAIGASEDAVSLFYGLLAPAGLALGAVIGGALSDRIGALRGTVLALLVMAGLLAFIATTSADADIAAAGLYWFTLAYFGIGALTASSYALFMSLARGPMTATKFSLLMAMTNACEAWSGFVGGRLAVDDYGTALAWMTLASLAALLPLLLLSRVLIRAAAARSVAVSLRSS